MPLSSLLSVPLPVAATWLVAALTIACVLVRPRNLPEAVCAAAGNALLIGVDLGPNLSVTGSLATILWLIALRREEQEVSVWSFLKTGLVVTPIALALAVLASTFLNASR